MHPLSPYDLILLQHHFSSKKEPTEREKAAVKKLDDTLLEMVENFITVGPVR